MATTGTIVRKDNGRWYVATHHRNGNGIRRQESHGGYATRREAKAKLAEVQTRLNSGRYVTPRSLMTCDYLTTRWLPAIKSSIRPSTFDSYERNVRNHVIPHLGALRLQDVSPDQLQRLYSDLLETGRKDRQGGLAPKTVRYIHTIIHKALKDALRWDLIATNPAERVSPPRSQRPEITTWTPDQVRRFLKEADGDRLAAAWRLAVSTGMRRGEVLGLRWSDMDLATQCLLISQTVISVGYDLQFSAPKTKRGRRSIPLDPGTVASLKAHRIRQLEERIIAGQDWHVHDLVFATTTGDPIHPHSFAGRFITLVKQSSLPTIRFHDLRHTFATTALAAGIQPRVVADLLGHATVAFTLDTYGHAVPGAHEAAIARVSGLFGDT